MSPECRLGRLHGPQERAIVQFLDTLSRILPPERLLAEASGHHAQRQVQRTSAVIHLEGKIIRSAGILLSVD